MIYFSTFIISKHLCDKIRAVEKARRENKAVASMFALQLFHDASKQPAEIVLTYSDEKISGLRFSSLQHGMKPIK